MDRHSKIKVVADHFRCSTNPIWSLLVLAALFLPVLSLPLQAQAVPAQWTKPQHLFEGGNFPTMVVDRGGRIHAMWTANTTGQKIAGWGDTLFYARLDDSRWSKPIDVLAAPPGSAADFPTLVVGNDEYVHAFWRTGSQINHSWAPVSGGESAQVWTTEPGVFQLVPEATGQFPYAVAADMAGVFHAVYIKVSGGEWGIVYTRSEDDGHTWSKPMLVGLAPEGFSATLPRLAVSQNGTLHVVWTQERLPNGWPPTGVYYSHSMDGGQTWAAPIQLAGEMQGWANLAAVGIEKVCVVWNGSPPAAGRYGRCSLNSGQTWLETSTLLQEGGLTQGFPAVAVDSANVLHAIFWSSTVSYVFWNGMTWSNPQVISTEDVGQGDSFGNPAAMVSAGNILHVIWDHGRDQVGDRVDDLWYASAYTAAPPVAPVPSLRLPLAVSPTATSTSSPRSVGTPTVLSPAIDRAANSVPENSSTTSSAFPLLIGIMPVGALLFLVITIRTRRSRRP